MPSRKLLVYVVIGLLTGGVMAAAVTASYFAEQKDAKGPKKTDPPFRGLDANLYIQTSAEYRACCLQAYALAKERVAAKVETMRKTPAGKAELPPAVVLDLDETVVDNGAYQAKMIRAGRAADNPSWDEFEENGGGDVRLVPGAKEFLVWLREQKVEAVYISNRGEKYRAKTHAVLKRLDLDVPDDQLHLFNPDDKPDPSNKDERRAKARAKFTVLLLVGDNLRDFDNVFKFDKDKGADGRKDVVDREKAKFGTEYILLPNPAYGEWTKGLPGGAKDAEALK